MRTDIVDLLQFYDAPLGRAAKSHIAARIIEAWPLDRTSQRGLRIAGFGFPNPYLELFQEAERVISLAPSGQGVARWAAPTNPTPSQEGAPSKNSACLVDDHHWPLPDASIDRLLIVHGLEETGEPHRLMREAWRVLADDGRLILVIAHRRGAWSAVDTTPFAAGRPYLRGQALRLFEGAMFRPEHWTSALFFPPTKARFMVRAASAWERAGARLWPFLGGVLLIEATKDMAHPVAQPSALAAQPVIARAGLRAPEQTAPQRPSTGAPFWPKRMARDPMTRSKRDDDAATTSSQP